MMKLVIFFLFAASLSQIAYGGTQTFGGPLQYVESPYKIPVPKSCQGLPLPILIGKFTKHFLIFRPLATDEIVR